MGMGEFNSDDHYIYYCGQEFHGRNVGALIINKRVWNAALGCNLKNGQNELSSFPRQVIQHHSNSSLYPYYRCWRSWSWSVLLRPRRPSRTNTKKKKKSYIHHWGLECKSRKSRDTWSNRQDWPWRTKWSMAKANWILQRERTGISKYPFSITREMTLHMDFTKWSIPKSNWLHSL